MISRLLRKVIGMKAAFDTQRVRNIEISLNQQLSVALMASLARGALGLEKPDISLHW